MNRVLVVSTQGQIALALPHCGLGWKQPSFSDCCGILSEG